MEVRAEFVEITVKLTAAEYRLLTIALANLAEPGSVEGRPDKGENLPLAAAELNYKMLLSRKLMIDQQARNNEKHRSRAEEILRRVEDSAKEAARKETQDVLATNTRSAGEKYEAAD